MATRAEATTFIGVFGATALDPTISGGEITTCIDNALVIDADGYLPTDDEYTETVDTNRAMVNVLDLKLAKLSTYVDVSADGTTVNMSQVIANVKNMRRTYLARCVPTYVQDDEYGYF